MSTLVANGRTLRGTDLFVYRVAMFDAQVTDLSHTLKACALAMLDGDVKVYYLYE